MRSSTPADLLGFFFAVLVFLSCHVFLFIVIFCFLFADLLGVGQLDDGDAAPHDGDGQPLHSLELLLQQYLGVLDFPVVLNKHIFHNRYIYIYIIFHITLIFTWGCWKCPDPRAASQTILLLFRCLSYYLSYVYSFIFLYFVVFFLYVIDCMIHFLRHHKVYYKFYAERLSEWFDCGGFGDTGRVPRDLRES